MRLLVGRSVVTQCRTMLDFIPSLLYLGYITLPWRLLFLFLIFAGFTKSPSILFFALADMDTLSYFSILLMATYYPPVFLINCVFCYRQLKTSPLNSFLTETVYLASPTPITWVVRLFESPFPLLALVEKFQMLFPCSTSLLATSNA